MSNKITYIIALRDKFSKHAKKIESSLNRISKKAVQTGKSLSLKLTAPLVLFGGRALHLFNKQEKALAQVKSGLEATGGAAGKTLKGLQKTAEELQANTLFGDEEILGGATAQLLTFTNIAGEQFDRTQKAVLDVATKLATTSGGTADLTSTSIMLGKALNDPVANLGALSRSGIQFSESQKDVIKSLVKSGKLSKAQTIILDELEKQYGGAAKAAAEAGTGGLKQLSNSIGDLMEDLGKLLYKHLMPIIEKIKGWVATFKELSPETKDIIVKVGMLLAVLGPALIVIGKMAAGVGALVKIFGALKAASMFLIGNPIIAGIAAVSGAVYLLYKNWDKVLGAMKKVGNWFSEKWGKIKGAVSGAWEKTKGWASSAWSATKNFFGAGDEEKESAKPAQRMTQAGQANLYGSISVKAEPGTKITKTEFSNQTRGMNANIKAGAY